MPSIRKHGGYLTPEKAAEALTDPDTIIRLATNLKEERAKRQELETENRELAPKAVFADAVAASDNTMLVGELAKLLASNGINIGQNRLFAWLRGNGYLMKDGSWKNMPTQRSMDMGLFVVKETAITHADGHVTLSRTPKVTGKGQRYFVGRFLDSSEAAFDCSIRKMLDNERKGQARLSSRGHRENPMPFFSYMKDRPACLDHQWKQNESGKNRSRFSAHGLLLPVILMKKFPSLQYSSGHGIEPQSSSNAGHGSPACAAPMIGSEPEAATGFIFPLDTFPRRVLA